MKQHLGLRTSFQLPNTSFRRVAGSCSTTNTLNNSVAKALGIWREFNRVNDSVWLINSSDNKKVGRREVTQSFSSFCLVLLSYLSLTDDLQSLKTITIQYSEQGGDMSLSEMITKKPALKKILTTGQRRGGDCRPT